MFMSQSATLYSISAESFALIEKANGKKVQPAEYATRSVTFQGTFMGLEFILLKDQDKSSTSLIEEIFNPKKTLGQKDTTRLNFSRLSEDEVEDLYDFIYYLPADKVGKITAILNKITDQQVGDNYNAEELNANEIYPGCWQNDNSENQAFNKGNIKEDFRELKDFFNQAMWDKHYVLCYVG